MRLYRLCLAFLAAAALIACGPAPAPDTAPASASTTIAAEVAPPPSPAQVTVREEVAPVIVEIREVVQEVIPPAPPPEVAPDPAIALATALIVRWEVSSRANYDRRLQGVICPGGASGPTWGLGWDGGHQTAADNRLAWSEHEHVERLAQTAGAAGPTKCGILRGQLTDVRVQYPMAEAVFAAWALPRYQLMAERKYGDLLREQSPGVRAALYSETYNRGGAIRGTRGAEQAIIRDTCLPAHDAECVAVQLSAMCRLWLGTSNGPGLCSRRNDEAAVARGKGS